MFRARRIMRRRAIAAKRGTGAGQEEPRAEAVDDATAPEPSADPPGQLEELFELREQGILTEEEFAAEKKKLLGS